MQILTEKIEWVLGVILESMDADQEGSDARPFQADESEDSDDRELDSDNHHTLIEPCW